MIQTKRSKSGLLACSISCCGADLFLQTIAKTCWCGSKAIGSKRFATPQNSCATIWLIARNGVEFVKQARPRASTLRAVVSIRSLGRDQHKHETSDASFRSEAQHGSVRNRRARRRHSGERLNMTMLVHETERR